MIDFLKSIYYAIFGFKPIDKTSPHYKKHTDKFIKAFINNVKLKMRVSGGFHVHMTANNFDPEVAEDMRAVTEITKYFEGNFYKVLVGYELPGGECGTLDDLKNMLDLVPERGVRVHFFISARGF